MMMYAYIYSKCIENNNAMMMYAYIYSKCISLFKIINTNQIKQYICEQNKYRSIRNSNQLNKNRTKKQS